jgi:hypothetical protein
MAGTQGIVVLLVLCIVAIVILSRSADADKLHEPFLASTPIPKATLDNINNVIPRLVIEEFLTAFSITNFGTATTGVLKVCTPSITGVRTSVAKAVDAFKGVSPTTKVVLKKSADDMVTALQAFILLKHCTGVVNNTPAVKDATNLRKDLETLKTMFP